MKTLFFVFFTCIFLLSTSLVEAQRRGRVINVRTGPVTEGELKAAIYKAEVKQQTGATITKIGLYTGGAGILMLGGSIIFLDDASSQELVLYTGFFFACAGAIATVTGLIVKSINSSRAMEYNIMLENLNTSLCIKPQYYITSEYSAIGITVRF